MTGPCSKVNHVTGKFVIDMEQLTGLFKQFSPWGSGCLNSVLAGRLFLVSSTLVCAFVQVYMVCDN